MGTTNRLTGVRLFALVAALGALPGCGPTYARKVVEDDPELKVFLRGETQEGEILDRGYEHPVTISAIRITRILSQIDVRFDADAGGERQPALPTEVLYAAGEAISAGLGKAGPGEQVVLQAFRKERRLGIFTTRYLTTLLCYVKGDRLIIHLRHVDWEIPKDERDRDPPEPWIDRSVSAFRIVPGEAMSAAGPQDVAVDWRDPIFRKSTRLQVTRGGRILRRTILMESPEEGEEPDEEEAGGLGDLSPETLRALADLEEERLAGRLTESEYRTRRRQILGGDSPEP